MSKLDKLNKEEKDALLDLIINAVEDIELVFSDSNVMAQAEYDGIGEGLDEIDRLAEMALTMLKALKEGGEEE